MAAATNRLGAVCCELGEGPCFDRIGDTAWWFDIVGRTLIEHRFATLETRVHSLPRMASLIAAIDSEHQLLVMEDGFYRRRRTGGSIERLVSLEPDRTDNRSNDGRVHPSGRLWVGTMAKRKHRGAGAIHWFDGREVRVIFRDMTIPNSICFSPDGRTGYFADSAVNRVWRVELDPLTALPTGEPELFLSATSLPLGGCFDGSVVDREGIIWNAARGGGSISGFAPDSSLVHTVEVPTAQTSCPCFVGQNLSRLLVTTAWEGYGEAERAADPGAGFTYVLDGGFRGQQEALFKPVPGTGWSG